MHNKVLGTFRDLSSLVWGAVLHDPIVQEASDDGQSILKADLAVQGVWQPQCESLFDIRVVDTDAPSYHASTPPDVLWTAEKRKYLQICQNHIAAFTPICVLLIVCWERKRIFSSIDYVTSCVLSGRDVSA